MHKFIGKVLVNSQFIDTSREQIPDKYSDPTVKGSYEVIRLIDGKMLFAEEHFHRMENSCRKLSIDKEVVETAKEEVLDLIEQNQFENMNIKILAGTIGGEDFLILGFIQSKYPDPSCYVEGAKVMTFPAERTCPMVKKEDPLYRNMISKAKADNQVNELLIYNNDQYITEGSASSFFYIKDGTLFVPKRKMALSGVTQTKVLEVCKEEGIQVKESKLKRGDIGSIEGGFLTGTSIDVFPIGTVIDQDKVYNLDSTNNPIIQRLMKGYERKKLETI